VWEVRTLLPIAQGQVLQALATTRRRRNYSYDQIWAINLISSQMLHTRYIPLQVSGFNSIRNTSSGVVNLFLVVMKESLQSMEITSTSCHLIKKQCTNQAIRKHPPFSLAPSSAQSSTGRYPRISRFSLPKY